MSAVPTPTAPLAVVAELAKLGRPSIAVDVLHVPRPTSVAFVGAVPKGASPTPVVVAFCLAAFVVGLSVLVVRAGVFA